MEEHKQFIKGIPYCLKCHKVYNEDMNIPLNLPCGDAYCKVCLTKEMQENLKIKCIKESCGIEHE